MVEPEHLRINVPVFTVSGTLLGIPDLIDTRTGLVLESDGEQHRAADIHAADNRREESLEEHGLEVVRFGALDHRDPMDVVRRIHVGRRRALAHQARDRFWTLEPPAWWAASRLARRWQWP